MALHQITYIVIYIYELSKLGIHQHEHLTKNNMSPYIFYYYEDGKIRYNEKDVEIMK